MDAQIVRPYRVRCCFDGNGRSLARHEWCVPTGCGVALMGTDARAVRPYRVRCCFDGNGRSLARHERCVSTGYGVALTGTDELTVPPYGGLLLSLGDL